MNSWKKTSISSSGANKAPGQNPRSPSGWGGAGASPPCWLGLHEKQLVDAGRTFRVKGPRPMTAAELFESITNGGMSDFGQVLAVRRERHVPWCLIDGLAVNC